MGAKHSRDYHLDTSGNLSKSSDSAGKTHTAPTSVNGAYVGVSQGFLEAQRDREAKEAKRQERSRSPNSKRRRLMDKITGRNSEVNNLPAFGGQQPSMKQEPEIAGSRGGTERSGYLRKLGFDQTRGSQGQNQPSQLLLQQNQEHALTMKNQAAAAQQRRALSPEVGKRSPNLANTMVPESKFTQILHSQTFKAREIGAASEVLPPVATKPGSAMDRAMRKHRPRAISDPIDKDMTYQEVPSSLVYDKEELKNDQRQTHTAEMMQYDESLFLDRIKCFSNRPQSELAEIDEQAEEQEFDITHVVPVGQQRDGEEDDDGRGLMNRNVEIETGTAAVEAAEQQRQETLRLDQMSRDRAGDKLRKNLLSRLTYEKIWLTPMAKPKQYETAIIFDWDDTLLCTSFISPNGVYQDVDLGPNVMQHIKLLEQTTKRMLELSVAVGRVYIITNACEGWVQFSCKTFMPAVLPVLQKIEIISARARYEARFPGQVPKWKLYAFLETQTDLTNGNMKNVVALGDSMMEMDAAHHLAMRFQKALIKTVKFREYPKPNELVKQLNLVITKFDDIINNARNLTIRLEKKQS